MLAPTVRPHQAAVLERAGVDYVDLAGNAHLAGPGLLVHVEGRRAAKEPLARRGRPNKGWVKAVLTLLVQPELVNRPYRDTAEQADVALGTVAACIQDLIARRLLVEAKGRREVVDRQQLVALWVQAYVDVLRPKLTERRFQVRAETKPEIWERLGDVLAKRHVRWALTGADAAERRTNYFHAEDTEIYAPIAAFEDREVLRRLVAQPAARGGNLLVIEPPAPAATPDGPRSHRPRRPICWRMRNSDIEAPSRRSRRRKSSCQRWSAMTRADPLVTGVLADLARGLRALEVEFCVIGALVPELLLDVAPRRMTKDAASPSCRSLAHFERVSVTSSRSGSHRPVAASAHASGRRMGGSPPVQPLACANRSPADVAPGNLERGGFRRARAQRDRRHDRSRRHSSGGARPAHVLLKLVAYGDRKERKDLASVLHCLRHYREDDDARYGLEHEGELVPFEFTSAYLLGLDARPFVPSVATSIRQLLDQFDIPTPPSSASWRVKIDASWSRTRTAPGVRSLSLVPPGGRPLRPSPAPAVTSTPTPRSHSRAAAECA